MTPPVSLIIPAYNEAGRLPMTLQALQGYRREQAGLAECIIVDDGSADDTIDVVRRFARKEPWCRVHCLGTHEGKGAAVRAGVLQARCEQVFFTDADLSALPDNLLPASRLLSGEFDLVLGSRKHPDAKIVRRQPPLRRYAAAMGNWLIRSLVNLPYRDTQCGFKGFRRETVVLLFEQMEVTGFMFDVEILVKARRAGLRIVEFPVLWADRPDGRFNLGSNLFAILAELMQIRREVRDA